MTLLPGHRINYWVFPFPKWHDRWLWNHNCMGGKSVIKLGRTRDRSRDNCPTVSRIPHWLELHSLYHVISKSNPSINHCHNFFSGEHSVLKGRHFVYRFEGDIEVIPYIAKHTVYMHFVEETPWCNKGCDKQCPYRLSSDTALEKRISCSIRCCSISSSRSRNFWHEFFIASISWTVHWT